MTQNKRLEAIWAILILFVILSMGGVSAIKLTTFNNSLTTENINFSGNVNITRYLAIPSTSSFMINAYLNLSASSNLTRMNNYSGTNDDNGCTSFNWCGQSFNSSVGYSLGMVGLHLSAGGDTVLNLSIWTADANHKPLVVLSSNITIFFADLGGSRWFNITLPKHVSITNGLEYIITLGGASAGQGANWFANTAATYAEGNATLTTDAGATWTFPDTDREFETYVDDNITNPILFIGNTNVWNFTGSFVKTDNSTINLATNINSYISSCSYILNYCYIPFNFYSFTGGVMNYSALSVDNIGIVENSQTYTQNTTEGNTETFKINISYDSTEYSSIIAYLYYNNTDYSGTIGSGGNNKVVSRSLVVPSVSQLTNITFYWKIGLINSTGTLYFNSTSYNQSISNLNIGDCNAYSTLVLNYTMYDEKDQFLINGTINTGEIQLDLQMYDIQSSDLILNMSQTWNATSLWRGNAQVCLQSNLTSSSQYALYTETRYAAAGYSTEYNYLQNFNLTNSTIPQNINLYSLNSTQSTAFLVTYKATNGLPVENAILTLSRKYIGEGVFKTVEMAKTDKDGQAILHFDTSAIYKITVSLNGVTLSTHENIAVFCEDSTTGNCKINLYAETVGDLPVNLNYYHGLTYTTAFNQSTRTYTVDFLTQDNSVALIEINLTKYDNYGKTQICYNSVTTSSGTLNCVVAQSYGNITFVANLYKDSQLIHQETWSIATRAIDMFGDNTIILVLLLFLTLPLMFIPSNIGVMIGAIFGSILSAFILYTSHSIIGSGSAVMWIIIAGGIIIWKISQGSSE